MMYNLTFISEENFDKHVSNTIAAYSKSLNSINLSSFNSNIIDPIKLLFDKNIYKKDFEEIINLEIHRQRDKSNTNAIGYFHQNIFKYIDNCVVPKQGWDVIYDSGVYKIYVEMKNKHNTMNSASSGKTFIKMQNQLLKDDDCACFLVEAIAKTSQNIKWEPKVDGQKMGHKYIRRVSLDQFYSLVTGQEDAFYQLCMVLPQIIEKAIGEFENSNIPHDTVFEELLLNAENKRGNTSDEAIAMAIYLLGFSSYLGFSEN